MNPSYWPCNIAYHLPKARFNMLNFKTVSMVVLTTAALVFVGCSKKKEETQAPAASEVPAEQTSSMTEAAPAAETAPTTDAAASAPADEKADTQAIAALDKPTA